MAEEEGEEDVDVVASVGEAVEAVAGKVEVEAVTMGTGTVETIAGRADRWVCVANYFGTAALADGFLFRTTRAH